MLSGECRQSQSLQQSFRARGACQSAEAACSICLSGRQNEAEQAIPESELTTVRATVRQIEIAKHLRREGRFNDAVPTQPPSSRFY
jgi:hypothetical protein